MDNQNFLNNLRAEILQTQKSRNEFVHQKLTFVTSLLGIGSISIGGPFETTLLLYIAPIVAFVFDLYVLGEDFSIKRAGGFLCGNKIITSDSEIKWEEWVNDNRDNLARVAGPVFSLLVLFVYGIIIVSKQGVSNIYFVWLSVSFFSILCFHIYSFILNKKVHNYQFKTQLIISETAKHKG